MGLPPLSLEIAAKKPSLLAGEALLLDVHYQVHAALRLAYVPLNEGRTRVWLAPLVGPPVALSARHHRELHAVSAFTPLDRWADVAAGRRWSNLLDLSQYMRALPAGTHRVWVSYQYGATAEQTVESNVVVIDVAPALALRLSRRWIPRSRARELLGGVAVVRHGDAGASNSWMYRVARAKDPTALTVSTHFEGGGPEADPPLLAHPDRHAYTDYPHMAVWTEAPFGLRWAIVRRTGRYREIGSVAHGLAAGAALVEPPLHLAGLGLRALVAGVDAATGETGVFVADVQTHLVDDTRPLFTTSGRFEPLDAFDPTRAVVLWTEDRTPILFVVASSATPETRVVRHDLAARASQTVWSGEGAVLGLFEDPASGAALALVHDARDARRRLAVLRTPDDHGPPGGAGALVVDHVHELVDLDVGDLVDAAPLRSALRGSGLVLLFRTKAGWRVVHGAASWDVPFDPSDLAAPPILVASESGIALLVPSARCGFERIVVAEEGV